MDLTLSVEGLNIAKKCYPPLSKEKFFLPGGFSTETLAIFFLWTRGETRIHRLLIIGLKLYHLFLLGSLAYLFNV
jgi:hypothetical protein